MTFTHYIIQFNSYIASVAKTYSSERGRRCTACVTQTTVRLRGAESEKKHPTGQRQLERRGGGVLCTMQNAYD